MRRTSYVRFRTKLIEKLDADVLVVNGAAGIMTLQRYRARADAAARKISRSRPVSRLGPPHHLFVVHFDCDGVALGDDVLGEPLIVFGYFLFVVFYLVEACSSARIARICVVYLNLETLAGPAAILKFGLDVDAAISTGECHDVDFQFEIFEDVVVEVAHVEAMAARAVRHDRTILYGEGLDIFIRFPAGQV